MKKVVLDEATRKKLGDLTRPVVLCDESGNTFARVFPEVDLSQYVKWEPPMDEAELRRIEQSNDWLTTKELPKKLAES